MANVLKCRDYRFKIDSDSSHSVFRGLKGRSSKRRPQHHDPCAVLEGPKFSAPTQSLGGPDALERGVPRRIQPRPSARITAAVRVSTPSFV